MSEDKLNKLPPALRRKNRYLKFKIHSEKNIKLGEFVDSVWEKSVSYLGTKETSNADFWIIGNQFDENKNEGILRVNREKLNEFRSVLTLIRKIGDKTAFVEVKKVSGSIKKVKSS